jgi:glycosyltransferase involved in cell wall biosynthesis
MEISLALSCLALALVTLNSLTIRVVRNQPTKISEFVSILIPMRNEEKNAANCVNSLISQTGLENFEILVLDDCSTDQTMEELTRFSGIKLLSGKSLPDGWLGKLWALDQLVTASSGRYLVFIDADVRLTEHAVASAIKQMRDWDFISAYPKQITSGFLQRIFQPLLQWSWLASVPLIISQKFSIKSMVVANGQFLIIQRDAYLKSGGFEVIKSEVLDDLMIARQLIKSGFKGGVAEASNVATCQMYDSPMQLIKGYQKSLWRAFGSPLGSIATVVLLFVTGVLPLITSVFGSEIGLISFGLILLSRIFSSIRTNTLPNTALLHPIAILFLIGLITYSWFGKLTKSLTWRDRPVL